MVNSARKAIEKLYTHKCDIYENRSVFNAERFRNEMQKILTHENVPCRVSFITQNTQTDDNVSKIDNLVKLFISPEIIIEPAASVAANVDGNKIYMVLATSPAIYKTHREYILKIQSKAN